LCTCCSASGSSERVRDFAENIVPRLSANEFQAHFRMSATSFDILAKHLATTTEFDFEMSHGGRCPLPVHKVLMVALWTLATPDSYRSVANLFDIPKSTVLLCLRRVCSAVVRTLCQQFIQFPKVREDIDAVEQRFANVRGMRNVIGAIDGCHIPIKAPHCEAAAYINRKGYHSLVLQAVVDSRMFFIDCYCGWPGGVHDARVFRNSPLYESGESWCSGKFVVGDAAYPLLQWLMVPYRDNGKLTPVQKNFNYVHSATRCVVERAFALLKGRFRRLKYLDMKHVEDMVQVIMTCCIFHNICLQNDDDTELFVTLDQDEQDQDNCSLSRNDVGDGHAANIRDEIADTLTNA